MKRDPQSLLLVLAAAYTLAAQPSTGANVTLPGHVIAALANATALPRTPANSQQAVTITLVLNLSDTAGRDAWAKDFQDPSSPNYRRAISRGEYTSRFGPTQQAYDSVLTYLQQQGFTLLNGSQNRRTLTVTGKRAQAEAAFNVSINDYQLGGRTFHAVAQDPALPSSLAPLVAGISGLSNLAQWSPGLQPNPLTPQSSAIAYDGVLTRPGATNSGGLPPGLNGTGQTVGLMEFDNFNQSDVVNWLSFATLPSDRINHLSEYAINGGTTPSGCTITQSKCGSTEVLLDIEAVMGIAQGANVIVFDAPQGADLPSALNTAGNVLADQGGGVLSTSWNQCEGEVSQSDVATTDSILYDNMFFGVTLFALTQDTGSTCPGGGGSTYPNTIAYPADAPHAIAVGGTNLNVHSDNGYQSESWWGSGAPAGSGSGGFGTSQFMPEPSYQDSFYHGAAGRSVPDVSIESVPGIVVCQGSTTCTRSIGGASLATPLWAAVWAIAQQAQADTLGAVSSPSSGYFYTIPQAFHSASSMTGPENDFAHVGLGSPDITKVVALAAGGPRVDSYSPLNGPAAGGTTVTITGGGFIGVTKVTFGGVAATHLTILSDTQLTVESPVAPAELAPIEVFTDGGNTTAAGPYLYNPEITKITANSGAMQGGDTVTVSGLALASDLTFDFMNSTVAAATNVKCSATTCTMVTPAHAPGVVAVVAETPWGYGYSPMTSADQFTFDGPAITSLSPLVGPTTGGLPLTLQGASLSATMTISFGGAKAAIEDCVGSTYCNITSPPHAAGTVPVTVTVNGITSSPFSSEFTFEVFPTVTGISQSLAKAGTTVMMTGTGFSTTAGQTKFNFFAIPVTASCSSTMACTVVVPNEVYGTAQFTQVTVTVNGNTSIDSVEFGYPTPPVQPKCTGTTCQ